MKKERLLLLLLLLPLSAMICQASSNDDTLLWVNAKSLTIEGMGWNEGIEDYTRLPDKYKSIVRDAEWKLSRNSSGVLIRFSAKGTDLVQAKWVLHRQGGMAHMTSQAACGLDLYVKQENKWMPMGVGKPQNTKSLEQNSLLRKGLNPQITYEFMLYLPLYNGVSHLELGFTLGATVSAAQPSNEKPLVFYGTSILQGCSASRAGLNWTAMLGRKFDVPVVNFGFSGNGFTEEYFGDIMGEIDAAAYVIDCLPNMGSFSVTETTERTLALVRKLKQYNANAAIVLVEDRTTWRNFYKNSPQPQSSRNREALKAAYNTLEKEMTNLYYVEGDAIFNGNAEATVDGSHPSDLGMYLYYKTLEPIINQIISKAPIR